MGRNGKRGRGIRKPWQRVGVSVALGVAVTAALCAVGAGLVMGGVVGQGAMGTMARWFAAIGVLCAGVCCGALAGERKLIWCGGCCAGMTLAAVAVNRAIGGSLNGLGSWGCGCFAAMVLMALRMRPRKRRYGKRK